MGSTPVLVVFVRAPIEGRVKTRLAASVGPLAACAIYRRMAEHVVRAVNQGPWQTQLWVDEADGVDNVHTWLGSRPHVQAGHDLGARMLHAAASQDAPCVIIGTDAPDVDAEIIRQATDALVEHDVVLGPAYDGGYYLIGLRRPFADVFANVAWSTEQVLQQTVGNAVNAELRVHQLSPLRDIDTVEDLNTYIATHATTELVQDLCSIVAS